MTQLVISERFKIVIESSSKQLALVNLQSIKLILILNGDSALRTQKTIWIMFHSIPICISHFHYTSFRLFSSDGDYYIGGFRQNKLHGKGEYEWESGDREIAYWVDSKREGKAKHYYKDGTEVNILFKDDKIV